MCTAVTDSNTTFDFLLLFYLQKNYQTIPSRDPSIIHRTLITYAQVRFIHRRWLISRSSNSVLNNFFAFKKIHQIFIRLANHWYLRYETILAPYILDYIRTKKFLNTRYPRYLPRPVRLGLVSEIQRLVNSYSYTHINSVLENQCFVNVNNIWRHAVRENGTEITMHYSTIQYNIITLLLLYK